MAESSKKLTNFLREVWRRRVLQVAIPYSIGGWLLVQIAEVVLDAFEAPAWIMQGLLVLLLLGFPIAVVLAWIFDISPNHEVVRTKPLDQADEDADPGEPEPAPALSLGMGDSERRQVTMLSCIFEMAHGDDPEVDPEYMRDSITLLESVSRDLAERYSAYALPSSAEQLTLVFGYPQASEDDARRAVTAGMALINEISGIPELTAADEKPGFYARIGVSTGLVIVDESHADERDVKIIGQAPRMATWLQGLASPATVVIGPHTQKLVASHFQLELEGNHIQPQFGGDIAVYRVRSSLAIDNSLTEGQVLTGRDDEMRLLADRWKNVRDGSGQFVILQGEPGIGKSSLLSAFVQHVLEDGEVTLIPCQCSPYERHNPLIPVIETLQGSILKYTEQDDNDSRLQKLLDFVQQQDVNAEEAVPILASLLCLETGPDFSPPSGSAQIIRMQTLELLLDLISAAAARKPVLLVLEDLHWADPSTLEMIQMMVDRGPAPGLFILFTARPEFQEDWTKRSSVLVQELLPLARRDARELISAIDGAEDLPKVLVDRIIEETDGNPLFIQELTLAVLESDAWHEALAADKPEQMTWLEIPATLQDSLAARIDNLGEAKALLQLCSVLGRQVVYDLLRAVSGTENETALKQELARIVGAELLYQRGILKNLTFTFKHILIQETAYNSLLKSKRKELHGRTAAILEQEIADLSQRQPALLAYHYTEAGDLDKAIPNWTAASGQSLASFALKEAIEQARSGIQLLGDVPESPQRAALEVPLQTTLGMALLSTYGYADPRVRKVFTRALNLCEQIGDAPQLFKVAVGLWMYYLISGQLDEAFDLSQRLLRIAETTDDPAQHLQARYCVSSVLYYKADFLAAKSHIELAMEEEVADCDYAEQSASGDDTRLHVRIILAMVNWHLGLPQTAAANLKEANEIARKAKHPWGVTFAAFNSSWFHQMNGNVEETLRFSKQALQIAGEKGFGFWLPLANFMQAWAENRKPGSVDKLLNAEGVEKMKSSLDQYRGIGSGAGVTYLSFKLAEDYIRLGMHDEALIELESGWETLQSAGEDFFESEYHRLQGQISLAQNPENTGIAIKHFRQSLSTAQKKESKALELRTAVDLAEVLMLQEKFEEASTLLTGIHHRFDETDNSVDLVRTSKLLKKLKKKAN